MRTSPLLAAAVVVLALAAAGSAATTVPGCPPADPILAGSAFVIVESPPAGARIEPDAEVSGCSRTHEGSVAWRLVGRDGRELAAGSVQGGGFAGAAPFRFALGFEVAAPERAHLELGEPRTTTEGFPPPSTRIAVVVAPGMPRLPLFGRFAGTLPCADCEGIATELALFGDFSAGGRQYVLIQIYRGTAEGDRRYEQRGSWDVVLGAPDEPAAMLVVLDPGRDGEMERERSYAIAGADLVQRDRERKRIDSKLDYTLRRRTAP